MVLPTLEQLTTALVFIYNGIWKASACLCRRHGLFHRAIVLDVVWSFLIHSYFQMENDQIYGIFYVYFLFHFCRHHTRI